MAESYAVIISNLAEKDLKGIFNYLQENVGVQTAINIRQAFLEEIKNLKKMPSVKSSVLCRLSRWDFILFLGEKTKHSRSYVRLFQR